MFDSESDAEEFIPAVLNRPKVANHIVDESFTVDTRDHEDHTFCGVMFDVACRSEADGGVPLEFLQIDAISVRGDLGPITVWTTPDGFKRKEHAENQWELVYEKEHRPKRSDYERLELNRPVRMLPGERRGFYVHSKLPGDEAIVYDNQRGRLTYEDQAFRVYPGLAHLSSRPFGRHGMWGFPWRDNREFVGRISYGVGYVLWNPVPEVHRRFPLEFRRAVWTLLLCARRPGCPLHWLQDDVVFYVLNMCKHDWFKTLAVQEETPSRCSPANNMRASAAGFFWRLQRSRVVRDQSSEEEDVDDVMQTSSHSPSDDGDEEEPMRFDEL